MDPANDAHSARDIAYHEAIAGEYDRVVVEPRWLSIDALFAEATRCIPRKGGRMLDLGTGTGHLLRRYADGFGEVVAVDHSAAMLAVANKSLPTSSRSRIAFVQDDAFAYLRRDVSRYDFISCVGFLHHLRREQRQALFAGIRAHLREDGILLISEPIVSAAPEPSLIARWNAPYRAAPQEYRTVAVDPDEAPLDLAELTRDVGDAGLVRIADGAGWEIFPRKGWPSLLNRWAVTCLARLAGKGGPVYWMCSSPASGAADGLRGTPG